jgi:hypothetical protein
VTVPAVATLPAAAARITLAGSALPVTPCRAPGAGIPGAGIPVTPVPAVTTAAALIPAAIAIAAGPVVSVPAVRPLPRAGPRRAGPRRAAFVTVAAEPVLRTVVTVAGTTIGPVT